MPISNTLGIIRPTNSIYIFNHLCGDLLINNSWFTSNCLLKSARVSVETNLIQIKSKKEYPIHNNLPFNISAPDY